MGYLKKLLPVLLIVVIILVMATFYKKPQTAGEGSFMKDFTRVTLYSSNIPSNYDLIDWKERAIGYDQLVFDSNKSGQFLPLIWNDETYQSFGLPAYVGDGRMHQNGAQEAVTNIAAVVSATLMGIDKSNQNGMNYVDQLNAFFSIDEQIILNNPAGSSETTSMWYLIYPGMLFTHVSLLYPEETQVRENAMKNIESWYQAYEIMYDNGNADFDYTGFNFKTMTPYRNDIWKEPDSAVGIAMLMYYGYELTGEQKYIEAAIHCMDYIENYNGSPQYEALMYYAPFLAAKLNAEFNTNYDMTKTFNRVFDGSSIPRGGWGSITGSWGDYSMAGLFGSTTDGGGYAFAMNTFTAASAIVPMVKYDQRYASAVGKWMLNVASNSRYYFADQTNVENQSCTYVDVCQKVNEDVKTYIPYEGIRKESNGRTPWFGGDPTVYGWAQTDFSLYSGAHIGMLAALIEATDVPSILKINVTATQFAELDQLPTYLFYNPYEETKQITYTPTSNGVDLFDLVTNEVIASNVSEDVQISIKSNDSIVITEIPTQSSVQQSDGRIMLDDEYLSRELGTLSITNLKNNETVSKKFNIELDFLVNGKSEEIASVELSLDGQVKTFENTNIITLNAKEFSTGTKNVEIKAISAKGYEDKTNIRLRIE